jgi:hypothetical protein
MYELIPASGAYYKSKIIMYRTALHCIHYISTLI